MSNNGARRRSSSSGTDPECDAPVFAGDSDFVLHCNSSVDYREYLAFIEKYPDNPITTISLPEGIETRARSLSQSSFLISLISMTLNKILFYYLDATDTYQFVVDRSI